MQSVPATATASNTIPQRTCLSLHRTGATPFHQLMDRTNTKVFGRAEERLLDEWYSTTLGDLVQINLEAHRIRRPEVFVRSELYLAMNEIASHKNTPDSRVYVYFGRAFSGKTSAGRALLEKAAAAFTIKRGLFLSAERGVPLERTLSKLVGAPETGDLEWVTTLFDTLAGKRETPSLVALKRSDLAPFRSCGIGETFAGPEIVSQIGHEAPIVIIDNVGALHSDDAKFIEKVYQLAQSTRVHVFVLTDNRTTANDLCRMNGRKRIQPLPGFYTGSPTGTDDVEWREDPWLVPTLSKLVLEVYDIIRSSRQHVEVQEDGSVRVNFLSDGDLPAEALRKADKVASTLLVRDQGDTVLYDDSHLGFL